MTDKTAIFTLGTPINATLGSTPSNTATIHCVCANADAIALYNIITDYWNFDVASPIDETGLGLDIPGPCDMQLIDGRGGSATTGLRGGSSVAADYSPAASNYGPFMQSVSQISAHADQAFFGWIYPRSGAGTQNIIGCWNGVGPNTLIQLFQIDGGNLYYYNGGSGYSDAHIAMPSLNTWHFIAGWRDSGDGKLRLSIDNGGPIVGQTTGTQPVGTQPISLFNSNSAGVHSYAFDGKAQYWGWANGILTPSMINFLYNSGQGRTWQELASLAGH